MSKFGLPSGEKETSQLRTRFNNYRKAMKKKGMWGNGPHETHLHRQNSFYEFNKPEYDSKKGSAKHKALKTRTEVKKYAASKRAHTKKTGWEDSGTGSRYIPKAHR